MKNEETSKAPTFYLLLGGSAELLYFIFRVTSTNKKIRLVINDTVG